jgi:hypothetical protein
MPKKAQRNQKLPLSFRKLGRLNIVIIAAFVLSFAAIGTFYVQRSEAATWNCSQHIYYQYEPGTWGGYCVKNIQQQLNLQMRAGLAVDGIYGPNTSYAVRSYNRNYVGRNLYVDNSTQVTASTWSEMCSWSYAYYRSLYNSDGCAAGNYGRYYVDTVGNPPVQYGLATGKKPVGA